MGIYSSENSPFANKNAQSPKRLLQKRVGIFSRRYGMCILRFCVCMCVCVYPCVLQMTFLGYTPFYPFVSIWHAWIMLSFNLRLPQGVTTEGYVHVPLFFTTEF